MDKPTILFAGRDAGYDALSTRTARGELKRISAGVYTSDIAAPLERVVEREWPVIVGGLLPGAVITDRSAPTAGPVDGVLYLSHSGRARELKLPGLRVSVRAGAGQLDTDIDLPGGLVMASRGRALVENTLPSRSRDGRVRRTLTEAELGDWIARIADTDGEDRLQLYRVHAESVGALVGVSNEGIAKVAQLIGVALGTRQAATTSPALTARQNRLPYDQHRIVLFDLLVKGLFESAPQNRPVLDPRERRFTHLPFYEAYFSNFIEGTEFKLDDALDVVYDGKRIPGRADDTHDLLGTYRVVNDLAEMTHRADSAEDFLQLLRARHAEVMSGRPQVLPGMFKEVPNQAGNSTFVLPGLVPGTLTEGWRRLETLDTGFERATYIMFLVAEVHPFNDGNGRVARIMMNSELVAKGQSRIIVPTVYRDDYLGALRRLTRQGDPDVLIKTVRRAHDYTAEIDFSTIDNARDELTKTNAFNDPDSSDRLILLSKIR